MYRIFIEKILRYLVLAILAIASFSCVPKATEKKAVCGVNQAFNNITRTCYSIAEVRTKPVGTLTNVNFTQETPGLVTLSYTDKNNDSAIACSVSGVHSQLEVFSPVIKDDSLNLKVSDLYNALNNLSSSLHTYRLAINTPAIIAADNGAAIDLATMFTALNLISSSFYIPTIETNIINAQSATIALMAKALPYIADPSVSYFYTLSQTRLTVVNDYSTSVSNKCFCSGGACSTYVVPKKSYSGTAGFSYSVTDIDGTGDLKSVIIPVSVPSNFQTGTYQLPVVESIYTSGTESSTSTAGTYGFSLGTARDYFSTTSFTYSSVNAATTYVNSDLGLGKITGCLGLSGSTGPTDLSCIYTPNDGDAFDVLVPTASTGVLGDLTFTALANGTAGNNISIVYKDIGTDLTAFDSYSTDGEKFGLITSAAETYVRVSGNTINVIMHSGVTTTAQISTAILNDNLAKSLVSVTAGSAALAVINTTTLAGGVNGHDSFSYKVSNSYGTSINTAKAAIHITSTNDNPIVPKDYIPMFATTTKTIVEDSTLNSVVGTFRDVDTAAGFTITAKIDTAAPVCSTMTNTYFSTMLVSSASFNINTAAPVLSYAGAAADSTLTFTIDGLSSFTGNACLYYVVNDGTVDSFVQAINIVVTEVNDIPTLTLQSAKTISNAVVSASATAAITMKENSTSFPSSAYLCITGTPGGGSDELTQILTYVPTQVAPTSDPLLILSFTTIAANAVGNLCAAGEVEISWIPTTNISGTTNVKITVTDNGKTNGANNFQSIFSSIPLTVTPVNDPPYFMTNIANVQSNEGGYIIAGPFKVNEDQANSTDENLDQVSLAVTSDNTSILMNTASAIKIFYDLNDNGVEDAGELRAQNATLESVASDDVSKHNFYIKLTPVGGTSGSANISIVATDGVAVVAPAQTKNTTFSFVVNSVAAIHGGWKNISAVGYKLDKLGQPASYNDISCNYDTTNCSGGTNGQNCTENSAPYAAITTTLANTLFWDNSNKKCYYSYKNPLVAGTPAYLWKSLNTSCPVSKSSAVCSAPDLTGVITPIGTVTPASVGLHYQDTVSKIYYVSIGLTSADWTTTTTICNASNAIVSSVLTAIPTPTAENQYYYDLTTNTCVKSLLTGAVYSWNTTKPFRPSKVTLGWNAFTLSGSGSDFADSIIGYNVYRREPGTDYNYKTGFLKTISSATISVTGSTNLSFVDTTAEAGKVYYYMVRPIDYNHNFPTYTPDVISEIRLIAPEPNFSFVHRWMINQEVCNKMHMTTLTTNKVDTSNNYRCPYSGPGSNTALFYDYGSDLLVDISEMSCPFTPSSAGTNCTNGTNGCVGIGAPGGFLTTVVNGDVYYDRSSGSCYVYNGSWKNFNTATAGEVASAIPTIDTFNTSLNPPLVNVTQAQSELICSYRPTPNIYKNSSTLMTLTGAAANKLILPEKKDFIAYSAAPLKVNGVDATDSIISDTEQGDSLNVQSRCNGSSASGLAPYYTDSNLPTSSYIYSLPGTQSSGIRSLYTGSVPWGYNYGTEACVSRYGIQDLYGNVAEWTKDKMSCASNTTKICTSTAGSVKYDMNGALANGDYAFDLISGPFSDTNGSGLAGDLYSTLLDSFMSFWNFEDENNDATKFSFPAALPIYTNFESMIACPYTKGGTCTNGTLGCIGIADPSGVVTGAAGEFYLDHSSGKCWKSTGGTGWTDDTSNHTAPTEAGIPYILDIGSSNGITYNELHGDAFIVNGTAIFADAAKTGAFAVGGSYLSTTQSGRYTSELIPTSVVRPDVGFRCMVPVPKAQYDLTDPFHTYSY